MKQTTISACLKINYQAITYTVLLCTLLSLSPFVGNTQMVTSSADDINDANSLRSIIANALDGATIQFAANLDTIKLLSPISFNKELSFVGNGPTNTVIDGSLQTNNPQLFSMSSPDSVVFANMSFVNSGNPSSDQWGGAMAYDNTTGKLKLLNCVFDNNEAKLGGAIRIQEGSLLMDRCRFSNNKSDILGGAVNTRGGKTHFAYNCLFYKNESGSSGGAIHNEDAQWNIYNSTFTKNTAATSGGAYKGNGLQDVINNIFYVNTGASGPNLSSNSPTNASQNLIGDFANSGITAGLNGNFSTNPNFADEANDDYHLSFNSPGINEGITYAGIMNPFTNDLDNVRRQLNGFPELGCYEFDNELCDDAIYLEAGISQRATNQDATTELTLSPTSLCSINGDGIYDANAELFYRFNGDGNTYLVTTDLPQTNIDTDMVIFTKDNNNNVTCVDSDNDSGQNMTSSILLETVSGTEYFIAVGGHSHVNGKFEISRTACDASFSINGVTSVKQDQSATTLSFCKTDADPTVNITGTPGGTLETIPPGTALTIDEDILNNTYSIRLSSSQSGNYTLGYTPISGCTEVIEVNIIDPPSAGDAATPTSLDIRVFPTQTNLIILRDSLDNEATNGTWAETSSTISTGFNSIGAQASFNPAGHSLGTYTFEYTVPGTAPCANDVKTITIHVAPENDDCSGAIELQVNATCINYLGTNLGATDSQIRDGAPGACAGYASDGSEGDVWYKIQVAAGQAVRLEGSKATGSPIADGDMAIYRGSCMALDSISCVDGGPNSLEPLINYYNAGQTNETIYIRYWSYDTNEGEHNLCISEIVPPAANYLCSTAESLTVGSGTSCANQISGTTVSATDLISDCAGDIGVVWYTFTTGATKDTVLIDISNIIQVGGDPVAAADMIPQLAIYNGDSCDDIQTLTCVSSDLFQFIAQANSQYWIAVGFSYSSFNNCQLSGPGSPTAPPALPDGFTFDICLYSCEAPVHSDESTPLALANGDVCQDDEDNFCAPLGSMYYTYTPSMAGPYTISGSTESSSLRLSFSIENNNSEFVNFSQAACVNLQANTSYQIRIDLNNNTSIFGGIGDDVYGIYSFCIEAAVPAVNTSCADAVPVAISDDCCANAVEAYIGCADFINQNVFTNSTKQTKSIGNCVNPQTPGLWYQSTVPASGEIRIQLNQQVIFVESFADLSLGVEVYTANCGGLNNIGCFFVNDDNSLASYSQDLQGNPLSPGSTIYIMVALQNSNDYGSFSVCFSGENCAPYLGLAGSITGTTVLSTANDDPTGGPDDGLIESTQSIAATAHVEYNAGKEIELNQGFEVVKDAVFHAYIDGCDFEGSIFFNEDFESSLSGNWLVGATVFSNDDRTGLIDNYFGCPQCTAPGGFSEFSSIEDDQGNQVFNVHSHYENFNHASGSNYVESYVYQERILTAEDIGLLYKFQFDHKLTPIAPFTPDINDDTDLIELSAFIKVLDPNNGYAEVYFDTRNTSEPTSSMETSSLFVGINPDWEGYVIQWGFLSYARNYAKTGVWYDHVSFLPTGL